MEEGALYMDPNFIPGKNKQKLRVAVVDPSKSYQKDLVNYYDASDDIIEVIFTAVTIDSLIYYLADHEIDVVLLNEQLIDEEQAWYQKLNKYDIAKIIIVTERLSHFSETQLIQDHVDILYKYTPIRTYTQRILSFTPQGRQKDIFTQVNPVIKEQTEQKIALFYSPKGGSGTTTIAINTAAQLALKDKKVLLVDFAIYGHVSVAFNLPQDTKGLGNIISYLEQGRRDQTRLKEVTRTAIEKVNMRGKELDVLAAASPLKMSSLSLDQTDMIMEILQELDYDTIIIDTSTDVSERNISLMSTATDVLFITTTDVAASWSMISSVDLLRRLNRPTQNRYLIINAYHDAIGFPIAEMESMLSMKVSAVVPYKYTQVQGYANRGIIMAERPLLKLNRNYRSIAHLIEPIFSTSELVRHHGVKRGVFA